LDYDYRIVSRVRETIDEEIKILNILGIEFEVWRGIRFATSALRLCFTS
jgi:hypothetical protein